MKFRVEMQNGLRFVVYVGRGEDILNECPYVIPITNEMTVGGHLKVEKFYSPMLGISDIERVCNCEI